LSEDEIKTNPPTEPEPEETEEPVEEETPAEAEQPEEQEEPEPEEETAEAEPEAEEVEEEPEVEEVKIENVEPEPEAEPVETRPPETRDMEPFIYRVRPDGLFVLDVKKTDDRIRVAGKFLARYEPSKIAVAATRLYAHEPVRKFCQLTGAMPLIGRFIPGMLSNPLYPNRVDPEVIVVSDPRADAQAVKEASAVGIPIVALCSTDNEFAGVDLVIPTNNKGRRALAIIFWLLSRQVLRERGELAADANPKVAIEDFEAKISREDEGES
jgi:small subunit ribosomal protein S2